MTGPHIRAATRRIGLRSAAARAMPIANAKPTCRLGTAANWLKSEVVVPPSSFSGLPVETVSTIPRPARRGGAAG